MILITTKINVLFAKLDLKNPSARGFLTSVMYMIKIVINNGISSKYDANFLNNVTFINFYLLFISFLEKSCISLSVKC